MKDLSNMVLREYIGFEKTEERFNQMVDFLTKTGIHRVILFSSCFLEESSIIPLDYYKKHTELLRPYAEKLRNIGVEVGINVLNTVGHAYYADENEFGFRRAVTIDGKKSRGCACIRDKGLIDFVKQEYKYYASLKPSVIFTDDDIRAISLGQIICLCEEHVKLISKRVGKTLTREEIETAILNSELDSNEIKEAYFEQIKEDIEYLISEIADSIHEISPDTEIGVMSTSYPSVTLDRDLNTFFDKLYDQRKVTRIRTGMDFYREGDHNDIPKMFSMPAIQREFIKDSRVEIQPEVENDIYGYFYKSNTVTKMQISWCLLNGFRNMQLNLFDKLDYPAGNATEIRDSFIENMPFYNTLTSLIPENHRTNGVNIYVNSKSLHKRRTKGNPIIFSADWHKWLNIMGIPLSTDINNADSVFLTGDDINCASDTEIDSLLKRGALIDLRAAEVLVYRGFGARIGIEKIGNSDKLNAGERFTDDELNGEFKGFHNSYYFINSLVDSSLVGNITYNENARIISEVIDHNRKVIYNGVAAYENANGERFCIMPFDNGNVFTQFSNLNYKRKAQLINIFEWLAKKDLPVLAFNEKLCVNINKFEEKNVISLFNIASDEITPKLKYQVKGKLKSVNKKGEIEPVNYESDGKIIKIDTLMKALDVAVLIDDWSN